MPSFKHQTSPYILVKDEETGLLYPKKVGELKEVGKVFVQEEEMGSPSSTRAVYGDEEEDNNEWDEGSLVHESYGRHTYNFGDTRLGPIYKLTPEYMDAYDETCSSDDNSEIDYP